MVETVGSGGSEVLPGHFVVELVRSGSAVPMGCAEWKLEGERSRSTVLEAESESVELGGVVEPR